MTPSHQTSFRIESTRGDLVESVHPVSVAVTDADGRLLAAAGDPGRLTYWRSAAKPFQAMPLVEDGAADAFGLTPEELALACASHSSERRHLDVAAGFLAKIGCTEDQLACGPHPPLGPAVAEMVLKSGLTLTPLWSNCSGKHAGMLALARHHGWETQGYERAGHPVQRRILEAVLRWSGAAPEDVALAVDGCTVVCFALPLRAMATAYARFVASEEPAAVRLRAAMMGHPDLVAGTGRFCTELMAAWPGGVVAKVGAEGVYSAALVAPGWGITLKVADGDMRVAPVALFAVLRELAARWRGGMPGAGTPLEAPALLERWAEVPIRNTRGELTGRLRPAGTLEWHMPEWRGPQGGAQAQDAPRAETMHARPSREVD
ncbi:MAG TPA: asparaginase [Gemmatimonadales bacterium]|nr:asparaginase [Gemmatimonadales bacterium]